MTAESCPSPCAQEVGGITISILVVEGAVREGDSIAPELDHMMMIMLINMLGDIHWYYVKLKDR